MDYSGRVNSKQGGGGIAGQEEQNAQRRQRISELFSEKFDISNDPYVFRNNIGLLECRLCYTTHNNDTSYLAHVNGKKHQMNLMIRGSKDKDNNTNSNNKSNNQLSISSIQKKSFVKIGKPSYKITKIREPVSFNVGLLFQIKFLRLKRDVQPYYRIMNYYEQNVDVKEVEESEDKNQSQYLIVSGEPYENICFKIPGGEILDKWSYFDPDTNDYFIQVLYVD